MQTQIQHDRLGDLVCPECLILLRPERDGFVCPEHGLIIPAPDVEMPPEFEGPDFHQR
ncbi:hypothetical protein [Microbacterium capsulatum]|uniref:Trm112 family protein n=1 Tax=Microbacterium capsulatum TaxID=3041921 RepID=A0ABU0XGN7_9MICO|nr:hypothetical protein [Microbacterium sp. ASV81]MDQ4214057.1 hypothetical protein [Microbacterium sp. ASV81]